MPNIDQYAPGQYAVQDASGNWVSYGSDQGAAERAYNTAMGYSNAPPAAATAPAAWGYPVGGGSQWYNQAGDLANSAANQQYLRDRLNQVDRPAFDLERFIGQSGVTGYYTSGGTTPMSEDAALDYIWSHWSGLPQLAAGAGHDVSTPEAQRAFLRNNWLPSNRQGKSISEVAAEFGASVGGMSAAAGGDGALPTFDREKWNEDNRQWGANRDDKNRQFYTEALMTKSGPRDWGLYQQMRPQAAFGAVTATPSWEQAAAEWWKSGQSTPTAQQQAAWFNPGAAATNSAFGDVRQPASIRPQDWYKKGTAGQEMEAGKWAAQGIDPEDAQRMMRAAWPTGSAPTQTVYR